MKIILLAVGATDVAWVRQGLEIYAARLRHYVNFEVREIPELKGAASLSREQIKQREGEMILKNVRPSDFLVLLDEHGREFRSVELSERLRTHLSNAGRDVVLVVGGAYGFSPQVYDRADGKISLSKMTFSHQMVRVIAAEQLYRAFTIIRGEPYHHE